MNEQSTPKGDDFETKFFVRKYSDSICALFGLDYQRDRVDEILISLTNAARAREIVNELQSEDLELARIESDYRESTLSIFVDRNGDANLSVVNEHGMNGVRFCTAQGGGQSPTVRQAIVELGRAIRASSAAFEEKTEQEKL